VYDFILAITNFHCLFIRFRDNEQTKVSLARRESISSTSGPIPDKISGVPFRVCWGLPREEKSGRDFIF